jgi:lysozyme
MNARNVRIAVASIAFSAAGLVGILQSEGYTDRAMVPTKNDRPTVGFGSTFRDDGAPVRMGDTIDPVSAVVRSVAHIRRDETGLKQCLTGAMYQGEYDILVDFAYQYGVDATCKSSMVRNINAGKYAAACEAYTLYRYSGGYDCSRPGNRVCPGVWKRNLDRRARCLSLQYPV